MQLARRGARHKWWKCSCMREKELWQAASRRQETKYRACHVPRHVQWISTWKKFHTPPSRSALRTSRLSVQANKTQHLPSIGSNSSTPKAIDCPDFQSFSKVVIPCGTPEVQANQRTAKNSTLLQPTEHVIDLATPLLPPGAGGQKSIATPVVVIAR